MNARMPAVFVSSAFAFACAVHSHLPQAEQTDGSGTSAATDAPATGSDHEGSSGGPVDSVSDGDDDAASSLTQTAGGDSTSDGMGDSTSDTTAVDPDAIAVAVGYGTKRVRSTDGLVWTDFVEVDPEGGDDENLLRGVGYGDGVFVAVGGAGMGFSMRSFDGIEWIDENHSLGAFVSDVAWLGGTFVAVGGNGLRVRSIDAGVTWIDPTEYFAGHYRAVAAGNGVAVAVGHTYGDDPAQGVIATTVDGAQWTENQIGGGTFSGLAITYGSGTFVAHDDAGVVRVSDDGASWSDVVQIEGDGRPVFATGMFVIGDGSGYWTSGDGMRWQHTDVANPRGPIAWLAGQYLTLGWPLTIAASSDLATWTTVFDNGGSGLSDIAIGAPGV